MAAVDNVSLDLEQANSSSGRRERFEEDNASAMPGGLVFQSYAVSPHLTLLEHIALRLTDTDAVDLIHRRARAAESGFTLTARNGVEVAEVCRRLNGVPLAVAHARVLSPTELLGRLHHRFGVLVSGKRTVPPRHQMLRAAVDRSYGLLEESERQLFNHLSVFAGSFNMHQSPRGHGGAGPPRGTCRHGDIASGRQDSESFLQPLLCRALASHCQQHPEVPN